MSVFNNEHQSSAPCSVSLHCEVRTKEEFSSGMWEENISNTIWGLRTSPSPFHPHSLPGPPPKCLAEEKKNELF